jgi:hypothetical protein
MERRKDDMGQKNADYGEGKSPFLLTRVKKTGFLV